MTLWSVGHSMPFRQLITHSKFFHTWKLVSAIIAVLETEVFSLSYLVTGSSQYRQQKSLERER